MKVGIYYGSETGNSEMLSEDLEAELGVDHDCHVKSLADVDPADLNPETFYLFVTSTYGNGDLPAGAVPFADALEKSKPDLSGIKFAMFGLGDQVFAETFNHGSEKLAAALVALKAQMVGERGIHDASAFDMPEDVAVPWAKGIMEAVASQAS